MRGELSMNEFVIGFGLFLVIEGLIYALFPRGIKRLALEVPGIPDSTLRLIGVVAMVMGVGVIWIIRG